MQDEDLKRERLKDGLPEREEMLRKEIRMQ
jgi:hypothetical protein